MQFKLKNLIDLPKSVDEENCYLVKIKTYSTRDSIIKSGLAYVKTPLKKISF